MIIDLPDTTTNAVNKRLVRLRDEGGAIALGRVRTRGGSARASSATQPPSDSPTTSARPPTASIPAATASTAPSSVNASPRRTPWPGRSTATARTPARRSAASWSRHIDRDVRDPCTRTTGGHVPVPVPGDASVEVTSRP